MRLTKVLSVLIGFLIIVITSCGGGGSGSTSLVDSTAPVVSAFTMPPKATSLTVAVSSFTATDAVGVTGFLITESASVPVASASGWSASAPTSFIFSAAGSKTAYAWAKDAAGNVSSSRSVHVTTITGPITASMNTAITRSTSTAVGTVTIIGVPAATACGLSVQITYPAGVTFVDAVKSGVTPSASFISPGAINSTVTEVTIAGSQGFGSGEVMNIDFSNVLSGNLPTDFGASIASVFDCNGVQIQ